MEASRKITNIVIRDVSKGFDKVWHKGLKYKIQNQYQLPPQTSNYCLTEDSKDKII